jgi:CRISPR/Cas system-associated exonuclease Cas4 (RecB family)
MNQVSGLLNEAINTFHEFKDKPRNYMGLSQIGIVNICPRKAWYMMHGYQAEPFPGRILRLFRSGDDCETNMVLDLKSIGLRVHSEQKEVAATQDDIKFVGHIDGIVEGLEYIDVGKKPCLLEIKSCNDKRFKELVKLQSYCSWDEVYAAQIMVYGTLLKLKCYLVGVENKNTSERYFERGYIDKKYAISLLQKAFEVYRSPDPPCRACPRQDYYIAKFCQYRGVCFA